MSAGMLAEDDARLRDADRLGSHDLIGAFFLNEAILVDSRFMGEGVCPHDCLVRLHRNSGDLGQQFRGVVNLFRFDPRVEPEQVSSRVQGHDNLLHCGVTRPLTDSVDRAFDLAGAVFQGSQGVGNGNAEVIVTMDGEDGTMDVFDISANKGNQFPEFIGQGISHRIRYIHRGDSPVDHPFDHFAKVLLIRSRGIHRREFTLSVKLHAWATAAHASLRTCSLDLWS